MGTKQSSLAKSASTENEEKQELEVKLAGERGRSVTQPENIIVVSSEEFASDTSDSESESECDDESVDEEDEELFLARLRILEDARELKEYAIVYLHPERPVDVDPSACARCYFDRPSAPEQEDVEEMEHRRQVLEDAAALKKLAVDYAHPELGIETNDPSATARCYFDRPSAPEQETMEQDEYRQQALEDAAALKKLAVDYAHPELGVVTSDPVATARSYFSRDSAPEQESMEESEYRRQVLEDASALKKLAVDYAHPEVGVVSSDPSASARSYFDRPSAPQHESLEEVEYRRQVLEDAAALKKLAVDYAHPELGVVTSDPTATARCYFTRPSAPQEEEQKTTTPSVPTQTISQAIKKKTIDINPATETKTIKTLGSTTDADMPRSLSSVELFGLGREEDAF